ncbi:hypothetical protein GCM10027425_33790 [Alteromonas gracilis]
MDTYGSTHHEASQALITVLQALNDPETLTQVGTHPLITQLLREQLRSSLIERLQIIGGGNRPVPGVAAPGQFGLRGLSELHKILHATTPPLPGYRAAPSDVLRPTALDDVTQPQARTCLAALQTSCAAIMSGSHIVSAPSPGPWSTRPAEQAWTLLADTAQLVEALIVVDERLMLHPNLTTLPARSTCAAIARESHWSAGAEGHRVDEDQPTPALQAATILVRDVPSMTLAQRRLTGLLTYAPDARQTFLNPQLDTGLALARLTIKNQVQINTALAGQLDGAGLTYAAGTARERAEHMTDVLRHSMQWRDDFPRATRHDVVHQLTEVTRLAARLTAYQPTAQELQDLNSASHAVTRTIGQTLRQQLERGQIVRVRGRDHTPVELREEGDRLREAIDRLRVVAPAPNAAPYPATMSRISLRQVLDATPPALERPYGPRPLPLSYPGDHSKNAPAAARDKG